MSHFAYSETGRKHKTEYGLKFDIRDGKKKSLHFLSGRNKRSIGIKFTKRKLVRIPGSVQHINVKETELGDTGIDGTVRETAFSLDPDNKISVILPGGKFRRAVFNLRKILQVSRNICSIRSDCMVGKTTEGEHLPKLI